MNPDHLTLIHDIAATIGTVASNPMNDNGRCVTVTLLLPREARVIFRWFPGKARWICFLYEKYRGCTTQSDGSDEEPTPAQATPTTAYHDLLRSLRERLVEKQALLDTLSPSDVLGTPF